jgi:hypothetical protein
MTKQDEINQAWEEYEELLWLDWYNLSESGADMALYDEYHERTKWLRCSHVSEA